MVDTNNISEKPLPKSLEKYFWDTDAEKINVQKSPTYICERLLEYGDFNALKWAMENLGKEFIARVIEKSRALSLKSINFYSIYFGINPKNILCLQEDFRQEHKAIWSH